MSVLEVRSHDKIARRSRQAWEFCGVYGLALGRAADVYVEFGPTNEVYGRTVNVTFVGADVAEGA